MKSRQFFWLTTLLIASSLVMGVACSDDDNPPPADKGVQDMSVDQSTDTSTQDTGTQDTGTQDMAADQSVTNPYNSVTAITNFLENKTIEMTGADIPTHPNGFDRNQKPRSGISVHQQNQHRHHVGIDLRH
jgi:hypothetical protein